MTKLSTTILFAVACVLVSTSAAQARQQLVRAQSSIEFVARQMGVTVRGKFEEFDAQIQVDPTRPTGSRARVTVHTGSATMGARETDTELRKPAWFDSRAFPKATFVTSSIKPRTGGMFDVVGTLTIKGVAVPLEFPVRMSQSGAITSITGSVPVRRLAFRIGDGEWADTSLVADEVMVTFKLSLSGVAKF